MSARAWIIDGATGDYCPGFYRVRLVKAGPWVACHLEEIVERDETRQPLGDAEYRLWIDGVAILNIDSKYPQGLFGEAITEAEYRYLLAVRDHALAHEPDHPAANPHAPIDLMSAPVPQF